MLETVEGIYQNGHIKLLETPKTNRRSRVVVTFLNDTEPPTERPSLSGLGEILVDDLEAASRDISQSFIEAIEKSGEEFNR